MISQKDRIEAAIRHIQTSADIDQWAEELAVDALNAQVGQASCEYCHEDIDRCGRPLEKNGHAFIMRHVLDGWCVGLSARGWIGRVKINYCPMCGRRLMNDKRRSNQNS